MWLWDISEVATAAKRVCRMQRRGHASKAQHQRSCFHSCLSRGSSCLAVHYYLAKVACCSNSGYVIIADSYTLSLVLTAETVQRDQNKGNELKNLRQYWNWKLFGYFFQSLKMVHNSNTENVISYPQFSKNISFNHSDYLAFFPEILKTREK